MKIPCLIDAENYLAEASGLNPGNWTDHSKITACCAGRIASKCKDLDEDTAYVLGLLHDIGRRDGIQDMRHIICGYNFMKEKGYELNARICLTHSFPYKDIRSHTGVNDCKEEETAFINNYLNNIEYDDYDRLIQLCDALSFPDGPTIVERRLVDVSLRRGFNEFTIRKWKAYLSLKDYFDEKAKTDIYKLFDIKI